MKLSIVVPTFNQIDQTIGFWTALLALTHSRLNSELIVVDNASADGTVKFVETYVAPHWHTCSIVRNVSNIGYQAAINQGVKASHGEIVACLHNDLYLMESYWDRRVIDEFDAQPKVGLAGFCGAACLERDGGRSEVYSNMLGGQSHGALHAGSRRVAVFDSLALIFRRSAFDAVGGMDESLGPNHFSDKAVCCAMHAGGWEMRYIGIHCFHAGGTTSTSTEYQEDAKRQGGDEAVFREAQKRFLAKWQYLLPLRCA